MERVERCEYYVNKCIEEPPDYAGALPFNLTADTRKTNISWTLSLSYQEKYM